mgnify:CR=1 FL=1
MVCQLKRIEIILVGKDVEDVFLPPFTEVVGHKDVNIYHFPEPKYVLVKKVVV